ncbi:hypothetical protein DMI70_15540 [Escherichia coli]|nr:hypothetical protein [Escherichia coli]
MTDTSQGKLYPDGMIIMVHAGLLHYRGALKCILKHFNEKIIRLAGGIFCLDGQFYGTISVTNL